MYNTLIVNVDELWLKGKNRPLYYKAIKGHLVNILKTVHQHELTCKNEDQRFIVESQVEFSQRVIQSILKVPGVHSVVPSKRVESRFDSMVQAALSELDGLDFMPKTFKVRTRRSYKQFSMNSMEISREVGHQVLLKYPDLKVDVKKPELVLEIRVSKSNSYISSKIWNAIGGLPCGMSGHLVTLISGGFDSPVASYLMSKRGCKQTFIFFYAYPFVGEEVKEKIFDLIRVLGQYQNRSSLYIIPFGEFQKLISNKCKPEYRTLFFRKYMLDCASILCRRTGADALLTGDSLGQVSSQTIGNISILDELTEYSIFRPLAGHNKSEIIELSRKIGTHEISILPHDDACGLFAAKHPIIRPDRSYVRKFFEDTSIKEKLEQLLDQSEIIKISVTGELNYIDAT